jgi:hypothetical protein
LKGIRWTGHVVAYRTDGKSIENLMENLEKIYHFGDLEAVIMMILNYRCMLEKWRVIMRGLL